MTAVRRPRAGINLLVAAALWWLASNSWPAATHELAHAQTRPRAAGRAQAETETLIQAALAGGDDDAVDAALDALRERPDPAALEALLSLTSHRRVGARRRAYLALGALSTPESRQTVARGLADPNPAVRNLCARILAEIGHPSDLPRLFLALDRGVLDATKAIGALGDQAALERFHSHLGTIPLAVMLDGYGRFVRRADIAWSTKADILHRLFEVAGLEVRAFLVQWHRDLPASAPSTLRLDLERSIRRIPLRPRPRRAPVRGDATARDSASSGAETP